MAGYLAMHLEKIRQRQGTGFAWGVAGLLRLLSLFCGLWICGIFSLMYWCGDVNLIDFTLGYVPFFLLPPLVAVTVRRLHDISKTGWLSWLYLVPLINILALGLLFMPGKPYANRFGPEPVAIN